MEVRREITIARDRLAVWRNFEDPEKRRQWQANLAEIEYVYGEPGRPGSVTQYIFRGGGENEVIEETVLDRKPPSQYVARYHSSKDVRGIQEKFETIGGNECAKITAKVTGTLRGSGNQNGADLVFEGDITSDDIWYFAYTKAYSEVQ